MTIDYSNASLKASLATADTVAERRAVIEHDQEMRDIERQRQLDAQRAKTSSPQERIRVWEKLHGLPLPRSRNNKLLQAIAEHTELTLDELYQEQELRYSKR